ncbi:MULTISPECIES: pantoate--beta-alanine ligase [unclassified Corynebacterium]|uniref:pantoate--beta-alanine ligase n=1 Tax=unclassified Corynebacterium TaxID=2624378 RepID=UPI0029CA250A|nr:MULTISPECIES: pantoate--beta-alanine ligase [unclassified Corynebacterium]WPF65857.1 pantoate--beta-alanine ligase [Corynebacterium sp. 22KM0430]WPF68350.1 pantoate--beta-alanine ligase [Corynebacterium sp. 21KM1197]
MTFRRGEATEVHSVDRVATIARAFRKTGKPVVLVPLGSAIHAGHISLVRAARRVPGSVVIVAVSGEVDRSRLAVLDTDVIYRYSVEDLHPQGVRTVVYPRDWGLEFVDDLAIELTRIVILTQITQATDVMVGEKDYELAVCVQTAMTDFHTGVRVHGVPTVRMPNGLAVSLRNARVPEKDRTKALALSAALTAGAHAAEGGAQAVLDAARGVLEAAKVTPEYLELRSMGMGEPPEKGDARLLVAAKFGRVRLIDNVGVPVGIGFRNIEAHAQEAEEAERNEEPSGRHARQGNGTDVLSATLDKRDER